MKEKARENLLAARALVKKGLFDPAASRVHYAAFQTARTCLDAKGILPGNVKLGAPHWDHDMVVQNVYRVRNSKQDWNLLRSTKSLREQADYKTQPVDPNAVKLYLHEVEKFVQELLP